MSRLTGWWNRAVAFNRRHATIVVLLGITAVAVAAVIGLQNEQHQRQAQICDSFVRGQATDRLLIDTVLQDSGGGGGVPLLDVASYNQLPPEVQKYVRDLAAASEPDDSGDPLAERLARFRDENLGADDVPAFCG